MSEREKWLPGTTAHEVCSWACGEFGNLITVFVAASHQRNLERMEETIKGLRHIVTRIEAYRRMKARDWEGKQDAIAER